MRTNSDDMNMEVDQHMHEWRKEGTNEWMNEWMNERVIERTNQCMNGWVNTEWMGQFIVHRKLTLRTDPDKDRHKAR